MDLRPALCRGSDRPALPCPSLHLPSLLFRGPETQVAEDPRRSGEPVSRRNAANRLREPICDSRYMTTIMRRRGEEGPVVVTSDPR